MKILRLSPGIPFSFILLLALSTICSAADYSEISSRIDKLNKIIKGLESDNSRLKNVKRKYDSGKYYSINPEVEILIKKEDYQNKLDEFVQKNKITHLEYIDNIEYARENTEHNYKELLRRIRKLDQEISGCKKTLAALAALEKEKEKRFQEGHAFVEVKINKEKFSRPRKDLLRWDWQFRFDEINGVGVTINKCWVKGMRGSQVKENKPEVVNLRIEAFGSALLFKPYMQYGVKYDKKSPGIMNYIYSGTDDNGNKVEAKINITRYPK